MEKTLYIQEPGDSSAISARDIQQGPLGDCFFLSAIGEIALKDPSYIESNLISTNEDGTENVTLYDRANGNPIGGASDGASHFMTTSIEVANQFPKWAVNHYNTDDILAGVKEIWPQVLEKAYAAYQGGYSVLNQGGFGFDAMEALTGREAFYENPAHVTLDQLLRFENSSSALVTFDTPDEKNQPYRLIEDHSYMFDGIVERAGVDYVHLLNPWGDHQPKLIPVSEIANVFSGISHGTI